MLQRAASFLSFSQKNQGFNPWFFRSLPFYAAYHKHLSFIKHPESVVSINENYPKMCRFIKIPVQAAVISLHSM